MHPEIQFAIKVFAALFAIMNPIANIPIFLSLTEGRSDAERRRIASVAILGVVVASLVSVFAGQAILTIFGLTIDDFCLAGGLIVLLIALAMLHGSSSSQHQPDPDEASKNVRGSVAVYPLTIPLLVGPGTISTLIVFDHAASLQDAQIGLGVGLFAMIAVLAVALWSAPLYRPLSFGQRFCGDQEIDGHDPCGYRRGNDRDESESLVQSAGWIEKWNL